MKYSRPIPTDTTQNLSAASWLFGFCGGLMEAAWLATVMVVPLMSNPYAVETFQPNKVALLRIFMLTIAAAWLVRRIEHGYEAGEAKRFQSLSGPLGFSLGALALAHVLATFFSVDPGLSLWGYYNYLQGTFTFFCELVLFAAVAIHLHSEAQVERLISCLLAASLPVALYGLLQRAGLDPIHSADSEERVFSLLGQPLYLADYLGMVFPLTLWRLGREVGALRQLSTGRGLKVSVVVFYFLVAAVQLGAFISTESRGPLLALVAGSLFFGMLWALHAKKWRLLLAQIAVGAAIGLFLIFINLQKGQQATDASTGLARFSATLPLHQNTNYFRSELWKQAPSILFSSKPITFPDGSQDAFHFLRPWFGYGPETLQNVLPQTLTFSWAEVRVEDRFHDLTWDLAYNLGIFGLVAFFGFITALFFRAYAGMNLMTSMLDRYCFGVLASGLALIGALGMGWQLGPGFAGPGLLLGLIAGICLHPFAVTWLKRTKVAEEEAPRATSYLLIALVAALVIHLFNMASAFSVAAGDTLFWIYAGLIVSISGGWKDPGNKAAQATRSGRKQKRETASNAVNWWAQNPLLIGAFSSSLILMTLLYGFLNFHSFADSSVGQILGAALTQIQGDRCPSHLLLFLFSADMACLQFYFSSGGVPARFEPWPGSGLIRIFGDFLNHRRGLCRS